MSEDQIQESYFDRHRKTKIFLLVVLFFITLLIGATTYAAAKLKQPLSKDETVVRVTVKPGVRTTQVAEDLEQRNIISSNKVFLYYVLLKGASKNIQAGEYELSANMTIPEIVERLTSGKVVANDARIVVPEGWTITDIASLVVKSGLGTKEEFYELVGSGPSAGDIPADENLIAQYDFLQSLPKGASLEGYLFPDTYIVSRNGGVGELVNKMLKNFETKVTQDILSAGRKSDQDLHSILTIASMVEGEVGRNNLSSNLSAQELESVQQTLIQERYTVSDVFWTRLEVGMTLDSDATICYALNKPCSELLVGDLKIKSPYNSYTRAGLIPGPINNPGLDAIKAAVNPANTEYLYFVNDDAGVAYFAKNLREHNQNIQKYLK